MSVHRIHPHVINKDTNHSENNNDIFNNLNNMFNTNPNGNPTSNFSLNGQQGQQINSAQFRGIIKLIIHILRGFLHVSQLSDRSTQTHPQHQSFFKRVANHFKK